MESIYNCNGDVDIRVSNNSNFQPANFHYVYLFDITTFSKDVNNDTAKEKPENFLILMLGFMYENYAKESQVNLSVHKYHTPR